MPLPCPKPIVFKLASSATTPPSEFTITATTTTRTTTPSGVDFPVYFARSNGVRSLIIGAINLLPSLRLIEVYSPVKNTEFELSLSKVCVVSALVFLNLLLCIGFLVSVVSQPALRSVRVAENPLPDLVLNNPSKENCVYEKSLCPWY